MRCSRLLTAPALYIISTPGPSVPEVCAGDLPTPPPMPISRILLFVMSAMIISIVISGTGLSTDRRNVSTRTTSLRSPERTRLFRSGKVFSSTPCFRAAGMISSTFETARKASGTIVAEESPSPCEAPKTQMPRSQ